jgi:hypothetical protein
VTVDGDVVRWVGKNQAGFRAIEQRVVGSAVERIATEDTVSTQSPEVTGLGDGRSGHWNIVVAVLV